MAKTPKNYDGLEKLKNENEFLREKLDEMNKMLSQLLPQPITESKSVVKEDDEDEFVDIAPNKYIKVMSLTNYPMVLTTQPHGHGKEYRFNTFGEVKNIVYNDLSEIIHNQESFAKEGRFYIMDKNVIHNHGLEDDYVNILTKKAIETILTLEDKNISSVFVNASKAQQNTIVSLIVSKMKNGESVDLNKVNILSKLYGENIAELAENKEEIEE